MDFNGFMDRIVSETEAFMEGAKSVKASELGLDDRCYGLYVIPGEAIACRKRNDRTLQYYGGFEYVDAEYRSEIGDWVFYGANDDRVAGHLDRYDASHPEEE